MAVTDDYRAIVARLRGWGFRVTEWPGCYGRQTGPWPKGRPEGHINHHYVCSLNPSQSYINQLVTSLANGKVVQWFADVNGAAYLIGTGQMSHAGTGNLSVLNLVRQDRPPPGPARAKGDISGNPHYSGTECQHPGDSTPWPQPMLDVMVAINAASFIQWGYSANRAINHYEHTNRKIDMSAGGGPSSNWAGEELRRRVAARMTGGKPPSTDWLEMATREDVKQALREVLCDEALVTNLGSFRDVAGATLNELRTLPHGWLPADAEQFVEHVAHGANRAEEDDVPKA